MVISRSEAVNRLGRELFLEAWTGKEHEARRGLISEEEWVEEKGFGSARGGGATGGAPTPKTIAAPAATALHSTGDPSSYQAEYSARMLAIFQFPFWHGGEWFNFSRRPVLTAPRGSDSDSVNTGSNPGPPASY